jgi:hypothetical protein
MGTEIEFACVDSNFRVFGLEALRIVDLSVCPFAPKSVICLIYVLVGKCADLWTVIILNPPLMLWAKLQLKNLYESTICKVVQAEGGLQGFEI